MPRYMLQLKECSGREPGTQQSNRQSNLTHEQWVDATAHYAKYYLPDDPVLKTDYADHCSLLSEYWSRVSYQTLMIYDRACREAVTLGERTYAQCNSLNGKLWQHIMLPALMRVASTSRGTISQGADGPRAIQDVNNTLRAKLC